ncbi:MAG TPA: acyl-CoA dehydrogenase, partial [Actinobacteria bacterium]|nr:acyl-CoA dehydrogenase [Actinomycetota bacterium]
MALALTEEHLALAESVRGWAGRVAPPAAIRAVTTAGDGGAALYTGTLRPALAGQGLLGLHLPESLGGQGYGLPELAVAVEELGRALVPGGFLPTVLASAILLSARTSALDGLVKEMAAGTLTGAVGLAPGIRADAAASGTGAGDSGQSRAGNGQPGTLVIDGTCGPVPGAGLADLVIVPVASGDRQIWVALDSADVEITPLDSLDLTRPAGRVGVDNLSVPADRVLTGLAPGAAMSIAATLLSAEACGIADWAVTTAAEYAKIRHQFGRPVGQFQGVKHRCAWMLTAAEQAAAAVWDAARALQGAADPRTAAPDTAAGPGAAT